MLARLSPGTALRRRCLLRRQPFRRVTSQRSRSDSHVSPELRVFS
jgi:hypothetical protein